MGNHKCNNNGVDKCKDQTKGDKVEPKTVAVIVLKLVMLFTCLYFFICSLSFLSDSFRMVGGRTLGSRSRIEDDCDIFLLSIFREL